MKFSLFTEIQCPEGGSPAARLEEFMEQAELADRLGFHAYWLAEIHCQPRFSLLSAPYVVLGAVAQRTKHRRLGVAVNTLPVHHPVQLAEEAAMLELVSNGRMEFAAGGGHPHSRAYECFGADHKSTHEVMAESLEVIPERMQPGARVNYRLVYVMCPSQPAGVIRTGISRKLLHKGREVAASFKDKFEIKPGQWNVDAFFTLPPNTPLGVYALEVSFEAPRGEIHRKVRSFVVDDEGYLGGG